jgi:structure-specific endonuclease subunit SLX1
MTSFVYLLLSTDNFTYVGATINLDRRLRQHNKEIKGGAFATGCKVNKGETWMRVAYVEGFPDWKSALQFEWRWKQLTRQIPTTMHPLQRRMKALYTLMHLERATVKAIPYTEWPSSPNIVFEDEETKEYYDCINNLNI